MITPFAAAPGVSVPVFLAAPQLMVAIEPTIFLIQRTENPMARLLFPIPAVVLPKKRLRELLPLMVADQ
jgi:hypothetical protein